LALAFYPALLAIPLVPLLPDQIELPNLQNRKGCIENKAGLFYVPGDFEAI
jgi:hypothetical protein